MANSFYVICTTPRSGSNLFCNLLESSGVMGHPSEYLNPGGSLIPLAKKYELSESNSIINLEKYLDYIINKHSTKNGVFGIKLLYDQFENFQNFQAVKEIFQQSKFIFLLRNDIIAQAVSMYIATKTNMWKSFEEKKEKRNSVVYDEQEINFYANRFMKQNLKWIEFFTINQLDYIQVSYEDILIDPRKVCHDICNFCGVETTNQFAIQNSKFKKQGDELNDKFTLMFREDSDLNINNKNLDFKFNFKDFKIV